MNTTNKALVVALALQVVLAAVFFGRGDSETTTAPKPVFRGFDSSQIERIEVFKGADSITGAEAAAGAPAALVMAKQDGKWVVTTHHNYPVSTTKLDAFWGKMTGLTSRGPIASAKSRQLQLQVAPDRYVRKLVLHRQGGETMTIYIGQPAGARATALRLAGSDDIHAVTGFSASSASTSIVGWIDTSFFEVEERQVAAITVENAAGRFPFARDGLGGWKLGEGASGAALQDPDGRELNDATVASLLRQMAILKLIEPVDSETATGSPLATVTIELMATPAANEQDVSVPGQQYTFLIGPERNGRYIVRRTDLTAAVEMSMNKLTPVVSFDGSTMYKPKPPAENPPK
jgi:hypothetical protein